MTLKSIPKSAVEMDEYVFGSFEPNAQQLLMLNIECEAITMNSHDFPLFCLSQTYQYLYWNFSDRWLPQLFLHTFLFSNMYVSDWNEKP